MKTIKRSELTVYESRTIGNDTEHNYLIRNGNPYKPTRFWAHVFYTHEETAKLDTKQQTLLLRVVS